MNLKKLDYVFLALFLCMFSSCGGCGGDPVPSSEKNITAFSIDGVAGTISGTNISLTLSEGSSRINKTPTITISADSTVSPASGVAQNFTNSVTYIVTAEDATTKEYLVTVNVASPIISYHSHSFFGEVTADRPYSVIKDSSNNIYIVGRSKMSWSGPLGEAPIHAHANSGTASDLFVLKLNQAGVYQWHTFYGSGDCDADGVDYAYGVAVDGSNNVYVTGFSYDGWLGDGASPAIHDYTGIDNGCGQSNIFVLKLGNDGAYQWHTFYGKGEDYFDEGSAIAVDSSGSVYVSFKSSNTWDGPGPTAPIHDCNGGDSDIGVLKLDTDGAYQWHTFFGSAAADEASSITLDGSNKIYVSGYSAATWDGPSGEHPLHAFSGGEDIAVLKLDSDGAYQWHSFYGSATDDDNASGITFGANNALYLTGSSAATWNVGATAPLHSFSGNSDISILKLDTDGDYYWHTFYGSASSDDFGRDVVFDSNTGVYVVGRSLATWNWDNSVAAKHDFSGGADIVVVNVSKDGAYRWHTFYGSATDDFGQDISIDAEGFIHVVGYCTATWLGDGGVAPLNPYVGGEDIVDIVIKTE